jgi:hypothetical protein
MVLPHDVEGSISIVSVMERERERERERESGGNNKLK